MPKLGCQTITFGNERIQGELPSILQKVQAIGYQGVEIGIRHLKLAEHAYYQDLFAKNGLELVALHIGGNFLDLESVDRQHENLQAVIRFAHAMGVKFILTSGSVHRSLQDLEAQVARLRPAAQMCHAENLTFCYHNHNWEINEDAWGLNYICEQLPAGELNLALDLGWVTRAGADPVQMIERFKERIKYVHIKDVIKPSEWAEVGHGDVNWRQVLPKVAELQLPWWITEMDTTKKAPEESMAMSYAFLQDKI